MGGLRLPTQIIRLTATLQVISETELKDVIILPDAMFIRTSTNRSTIQYSVYRADHGESGIRCQKCKMGSEDDEKRKDPHLYE
jgi:hypothetical protein